MNFNGECENMMTVVSTPHHPPTSDYNHDHNHILSIEIKATDKIIILPDVETSKYEFIQYTKKIITPKNIIFMYMNVQVGILYHHRYQTIIFHKFGSNSSLYKWII